MAAGPGRTTRLLLWPLLVLVIAVALGAGVGGAVWGVLTLVGGSPDDGWQDLGRIVLAMMAAAATGALVWLLGVVSVARRLLPPGRRVLPVVVAVVGVTAILVVASAADLGRAGGVALLALAVATPSAVLVLAGRTGGPWDGPTG